MIDCGACGARNRPGRRFCGGCGAPLAASCPACGFANEPDEQFCGGCGRSLVEVRPTTGDAAPAARTPASDLSPATYTPRHLAEKILASRAGLEGERKQVTVLFANIKGSTELIQDRDPEEAQQLLDGAVQVMMDAVHRYEGTVSRLMGDGLMAIFGAPVAHEDHAVRACYAALSLQDSMRRYEERVRRTHGVGMEARIGLNSGEVVVRLISDDLHMDYTAMGQTVHLASRLEQLAREGTALLSSATLALVEGYVQVLSLGPVPVKGLEGPIEIYELIGAGQARTRLQAAAARGLTRFVGRQSELETLHAALAQAGNGHGQVAALVGEPGVGKSRLVWELTHSHRVQDWTVLESGSVSYGKATSWLPVSDLLRAYCRIEPRDDQRAIREKLIGKLLNLDEGLRPALPAFLALLDVAAEDPDWDALDGPQRRRATLDAVRRLFLREAQVQPLLLVFEDLHWIDAETQALLDALVESLPAARLLLLVNYRPEYRHAWGNKTYYTQLRVDPLPPASAGELLASLLGDGPSLEPLKSLLAARTEGNPFFLEECVRELVETGLLAGERGAHRLTRAALETRVPATVQAILAARIDRLTADDKQLLQTAAVVGMDVPYRLLEAVASSAHDALGSGLGRLQAAEFLFESALFPELEYTFKHALTHEVAYGSLLGERRRALHRQVVAAIERLYGDRLAEHAERLAHHALRGEAWEKALVYCRQAGVKAGTRSALPEAAAFLEQAVGALERLHGDVTAASSTTEQSVLELAVDLRTDLGRALTAGHELHRARQVYLEAEQLAERLGDHRRQATVLSLSSTLLMNMGDGQGSIEYGRRTLAVAESADDAESQGVAANNLGFVYLQLGDYRQGAHWLTRCLELAGTDLTRQWAATGGYSAVVARSLLARCHAELGDFERALPLGREAIQLADEIGQPTSLLQGSMAARSWLLRGDADAVRILEPAVEWNREWQIEFLANPLRAGLGLAYALAGRTRDALAVLTEITSDHSGRVVFATTLAQAAEAYMLAGQIDRARELAERALERARAQRARGAEAWTLLVIGELSARSDPPLPDQAESYLRQALALAKELEGRPLQARCHLGLGTLYRRTGRLEEARAELATSVAMLREMGMAFWLPEAEAELTQADGSVSGDG